MPEWTRTLEKSWPKRCSMSCRSAGSSGLPGLAKVRSTLAGAVSSPLDCLERRWMRGGAPLIAGCAGDAIT